MRIAIIDANYNKDNYRGLAATWLQWELHKAGVEEVPPDNADIVLCTVSSQQGVISLRGALKRLNKRCAKVLIGGGGAWAPAIFDPLADAICVGEGAHCIRVLLREGWGAMCTLPEVYIPGATRSVIPNEVFPWELPPLRHPDGTIRVFASRGCRYRCLFCQTGWESSYRVNPDPARLRNQIHNIKQCGERLAVVTNDGGEKHAYLNGQQEFLSVRLQNLLPMLPLTRAATKSVRIGVEGISERLRLAVGKPVGNEDLLNASFSLLANGVGVRWFFIVGLPGERDSDYTALRWLVSELHKLPKGVVMMNFHAYIPMPATPLGVLPLRDEYWERFDEFRRWFFHGPGFTRHVQIIAPARYPGRLKRATESMAASVEDLRRGWFDADNPNWIVKYPATPYQLRHIARIYEGKTVIPKDPHTKTLKHELYFMNPN